VAREFLKPAHTRFDPVKLYSFTGSKAYTLPARKLAMRRNYSKLLSTLALARIIPASDAQTPDTEDVEFCATGHSVHSLPDILRSVLPNWSDRRAERWDRWRRENGRKSRNPGRMRQNKIGVSSTDGVADY
jgi:hypothetical protein